MSMSLMASVPKTKPQVTVEKAKLTKITRTLLYPALIKSRVESNMKAEEDFIVIRQIIGLGQKVKKGDKLIELRQQDTSVNYQNRILRAPVDGVVAAIFVNQGEYIQKGQAIALINNPEELYLKIEIPLAHHQEVKSGLKAIVKSSMMGDKKITAEIIGIGTVMDPASGTIPVELAFTEKNVSLLSGSIMQVEIILNEEDKFVVSEKALYYSGEKIFLPILKAGKVTKKEVTLGARENGKVEINEGLQDGDDIITGAGEFLKDNQEVEVIKAI